MSNPSKIKDRPAEILPEGEPLPPPIRGLTTYQAAKRLGMSAAWVKLHADDIGGVLTRAGYRFPSDITIERVSERITVQSTSSRRGDSRNLAADKASHEREMIRQVFKELDKGTPTREIVMMTGESPEKIRALAREWISCGQFDNDTLAVIHGRREPDQAQVAPPMIAPVILEPAHEFPEPSSTQGINRPETDKLLKQVREALNRDQDNKGTK